MKMSCRYCGIVEKPHNCPKAIKRKANRTRTDKKHYESKVYKKNRRTVLNDCDNLCLWSLYIDGRVEAAEETHHIIEILEDESKAEDYNNLIPLTIKNHDIVHEYYNRGGIVKEKVQELLILMLNDYKKGDITLKKYRDYLNRL